MNELDIAAIRAQFPALTRTVAGRPVVHLDGPAGSQIPQRVLDGATHYLTHENANTHGSFVTARLSDSMLVQAREAVADLLGADDSELVVFGPNMTTLTLALSRAMARRWTPGDEIVVTRLDHDANVTPWVLAARDAGATVHHVPFRPADTTLDLDALHRCLGKRTRLVAVGAASNATGTINPIREICQAAHRVDAEVFVDAVHYAPHAAIDVQAWGCDYLSCSAYKFFGPHVGMLWGRREPMAGLPVYQVRPAGDAMPDRWMTGTQNHEGIAGTLAAIDYLADLGRGAGSPEMSRRDALVEAFDRIGRYERSLAKRLLEGLSRNEAVRIYGITDVDRLQERTPTISFTHRDLTPRKVAEKLGEQGIFVWEGNYYALEVTEQLGLEPDGMVRVGMLHYNTAAEVDRLIEAVAALQR